MISGFNKLLIPGIFLFFSFSLLAQNEIKWVDLEYDFGIIKEEEGKKDGLIRFVNISDSPVSVVDVIATCGCTKVDFEPYDVAPGDTAKIKFSYNPSGRPGKFNKSIKIYIGKDKTLYRIPIKGTVIGSRQTLQNMYPRGCGTLRIENNNYLGREISKGEKIRFSLNCVNTSEDTIYLNIPSFSKAITTKITPEKLSPGEEGNIMITYTGGEDNKIGSIKYLLPLVYKTTTGEETECDEITISAFVRQTDDYRKD